MDSAAFAGAGFLYDAPRFLESLPLVPFPVPSAGAPLRALRLVLLGGVVVLALSACGRKGPLEPPPGAANVADNPLEEKEETFGPKPLVPSISPVGSKKGKPITAPKQPFFLDSIL
jgi:predicted small lipoprotein YifL